MKKLATCENLAEALANIPEGGGVSASLNLLDQPAAVTNEFYELTVGDTTIVVALQRKITVPFGSVVVILDRTVEMDYEGSTEALLDGEWTTTGYIQAGVPTAVRTPPSMFESIGYRPPARIRDATVEIVEWADDLVELNYIGGPVLTTVPTQLPASIESLHGVFSGASIFNQNISTWDVGNVESFGYAFEDALLFNQPIASWDIHSARDMDGMFYGAESFNQDLYRWSPRRGTIYGEPLDFDIGAVSWDLSRPNWYYE